MAQAGASEKPRASGLGLEAVSMPVLVVARTTDKVVFICYVDDHSRKNKVMESVIIQSTKSTNQTSNPNPNYLSLCHNILVCIERFYITVF